MPPGPGGAGRPPWARGRRFARRRRAVLPLTLVAIALAARRAMQPRRPEVNVFVGVVFRPVAVVDVSLFGRGARRRRGGLARLIRRARR